MKGGEETKDIYGIFYIDKINLEQGKFKKKSVGFKVNYQTTEKHSASFVPFLTILPIFANLLF